MKLFPRVLRIFQKILRIFYIGIINLKIWYRISMANFPYVGV